MRSCGIFAVLISLSTLVFADVSHLADTNLARQYQYQGQTSRNQQNYDVRLPEIDLLPPEPHAVQYFNTQPAFETNYVQQASNVQQSTSFQGPEYLPPIQTQQYLAPYQNQQVGQQYQSVQTQPKIEQHTQSFAGPKYLPPQNHYQAPTYLPPAPEPRQQAVSEPIFAMNLALPDGYDFIKPEGAEAAIAELHTLPADDVPISAPALASAYFEPEHNNYQAGKVRTVQILNDFAVKTLKVLETYEDGVRTIKILGASSDTPTGEHRVVKVQVPGAHTQTIKVYNDHKNVEESSRTTLKRSIRVSREGFYTKLQR